MFLFVSLSVIAVDQVSKYLLWNYGSNTDLIGDFLRISLVKNSGAAFGILPGARVFFLIASVIAAIVLTVYYFRTDPSRRFKRFLIALIFGGAVGNLIDRALMGEVIDFIDIGIGVHRWPVFNVADMAVSLGALSLAVLYLIEDRSKSASLQDSDGSIPSDSSVT